MKMNINSGIPQCKNCWKWDHTIFAYCTHGIKCQKCNGPHKLEYYRKIVWYYKANFKTNPLKLETKKEKFYTPILICSSTLTIRAIVKQTAMCICSENIDLTMTSITKSLKSSKRLEPT